MKSTYIFTSILVLFLGFSFQSCNKSAPVLFFIESEFDREINGGLNSIETHFFPTNNIPTFWTSFSQNSSAASNEEIEIFPDRAIITSKFGDNLDFINSVSIWVYSTDYQNGTEIFYQDNIDFGNKTEIELLSGISELSDWLKQDEMLIELRLNFRQFKASSTELRLKLDFAAIDPE